MMVDRSVSDVSLSALRHSERHSVNGRSGCFEHRIDQSSENSLRVLMLCEQYREDINGSIDQFPSRRLKTPLVLVIAHRDQHAEIDRHVQWGDNGRSSKCNFGSTAVAKHCELALDHH